MDRVIPSTSDKVEMNTDDEVNENIHEKTMHEIYEYADRDYDEISDRIKGLEREWDIERVLETNAAALAITGTILGFTASKKWFILPGIVGGLLLTHAVQGWCPPVALFRRLGVRTSSEIEDEKAHLRYFRGDFYKYGNWPI